MQLAIKYPITQPYNGYYSKCRGYNSYTQQCKYNNCHTPFNNMSFVPSAKTIIFMGKTVYIVDGGTHATNMQHFAKAISKSMDIEMRNVQTNPKNSIIKQLMSLEQELKKLNKKDSFRGEYIAIPALTTVAILNLQDQYNRVMGDEKKFTPENLKRNKNNILAFLKKIYDYPAVYRQYINYMDHAGQGIEYTYGVIQEINKLKEKGARVYIPSGHPHNETLKWMAGQRNQKPELYHYIATGNDVNNVVRGMYNEIKQKNWYDFNLLSLSDAIVVGVKEASGAQDYIFAAYDSCVTDGMRGVYNFSPVRKNGELIGYSYTDTTTNEYPYKEFPANDEVANLVKFVGKPYLKLVANKEEISILKQKKGTGRNTLQCADKLYPVEEIFSPAEIKEQKIKLMGRYVDRTLKTFFDVNNNGEAVFPNCNCEGSQKPSVLSMWGSCFSVFNAIARDIKLNESHPNYNSLSQHINHINNLKKEATTQITKHSDYSRAEKTLLYAINEDKSYSIENPDYYMDFEPHYLLGNIHFRQAKYDYASSCYNIAINLFAKKVYKSEHTDLQTIHNCYEAYRNSKNRTEEYDRAIERYNNRSELGRLFSSYPTKPFNYGDYKSNLKDEIMYKNVLSVSEMFSKLADICRYKNESYPAKVCSAVALDIKSFKDCGNQALKLRSQDIQYLGDLYPEIKEKI